MRSFYARGVALAFTLASLANVAWAQDAGLPSLLPLPPLPAVSPGPGFPVSRAGAANDANWYATEQSPAALGSGIGGPAQVINPSPAEVIAPGYEEALKSGYDSCTSGICGNGGCGNACGCGHYVYANALAMTHNKMGGFVPGVDSATGNAALFFCQPEFGRLWHGGMEIGTGWCFGCNCNSALEVVYWGVWPSTGTAQATGSINSTIDFGDLTYNGVNANNFFQNAQIQQVQYGFNFNSLELNVVGNSWNGGPFGCGMCGCCNGRGGSPFGFGWVGGFRYINFTEHWLYRSDTTDQAFNGDPTELNYRMQLNNNLFGFQLGGGISYCVTNRLTAYSIGKFGIYDNHFTQFQTVYGTLGTAVVANGPFVGQPFNVRSTDNVFSTAGQFDLGGRWAVSNNLSVNFGYRVLALSGVAIAEDNVIHNQFHNLDGIRSGQAQGSFVLHGAFAGATYCW